MARKRSPQAQALHELETSLTNYLEAIQDETLEKVCALSGGARRNLHSLHGQIGGKNNVFVDSVRTKFLAPEDFLSRWLRGLMDQARGCQARGYLNAAGRLARLLRDDLIRDYTFKFLERNFYRNLEARTRDKPDEVLWKLWFGDNKLTWGLIIAPAHRDGEWTNDVSEIRRARYKYWTVGHVLETGLVDPENIRPTTFTGIGELLTFYASILKRVSNSQYEKAVADRYISYLEQSDDPHHEPFLIPELRYAGLGEKHLHRLDYSVLNPHTMEFVGFELSPHSTHGAIKGLKEKTQAMVNEELCERWEKEMAKRNDYFATFGITTVTFTDKNLKDMDACFEVMAKHLSRREEQPLVLAHEVEELQRMDLSGAVA